MCNNESLSLVSDLPKLYDAIDSDEKEKFATENPQSIPGSVDQTTSNEARTSSPNYTDNNFKGYLEASPTLKNRGTFVENHYSDEQDKMAQSYPPGFAVNGSKNLPIPDINSSYDEVEANKARRRRRKKRHVATEGGAVPTKATPEAKFVQNSFEKPEYIEPAIGVIPPIKSKTVAFTATTAIAISPILPEMDKTEKPEPVAEHVPGVASSTNGIANEAFHVNETSFVTLGDETKSSFHKDTMDSNPERSFYKRPKATLFFHDGSRHIDYILAYEVDEEQDAKDEQKRIFFENALKENGLELETEPKEKSQDQKTCFVKIHVPWPTQMKYAERMKMNMPLKEDKTVEQEKEEPCCNCMVQALTCCVRPCTLKNPELQEKFAEPDCFTADFSVEKQDFFDIQDTKTFFNSLEKSRMAHRILSETRYGEERTDVGIASLLSSSVYTAAFPLHEGKFASKESKMEKDANMRRLLYWEWARWGRWYKFQPLDLIRIYLSNQIAMYFAFLSFYIKLLIFASVASIAVFIYGCANVLTATVYRNYLGDRIALYFAWLGFYTEMLIYSSVVGLIIFIYSIATVWNYPPVQEVCDENYPTYAGNLTMCPLCDIDCTYWKLGNSCLASRITYVFDNESTIFFAVFMSLWATMFLEFWKRRQFKLSYDWDLVDYDEDRDLVRPEFEARVDQKKLNPVTGELEPYLATRDRYTRTALSLVTVIFWIIVVVAAVFAIIIYRLVIHAIFAVSVDFSSLGAVGSLASPSLLTTITASVISVVVIMILNKLYEMVAFWLTNMELPRTQIEFEDSFTLKMFCFQFVNFYSFLFYVAFFKSPFAGYPYNYTYLGEWRWDQCDAGGCMYELSIQLITIMLGKQVWNNIIELVWPWLINKYRQWKSKKASSEMPDNEYTRWEQDYDLQPCNNMTLFYEYLEMVIQFGFVTLFVVAFPLAPLLALFNNIVEIRLDANKFICEIRRPLARKCSDIGAWYYLLDFIANLAVVTNAFTLAITSEAIPKLVYFYVYSLNTNAENSMRGYTNDKLSIFNVNNFTDQSRPSADIANPFPGENTTECRYLDYRSPPTADPPYALTLQYWHVIAAKLAFVIVMEHVVFLLKSLVDYAIPDRSRNLQDKIKREHFLVREMIVKAEKEKLKRQLSAEPPIVSNFSVLDEKITTPM